MKRRSFLQAATAASALTGLAPLDAQEHKSKAKKSNALEAMPDYSQTGVTLIRGSTPTEDGFHFPAEWEKHESTIMVMPPPQNWKGYGIPLIDVRNQWAKIANKLSEYEPVLMVINPQERKHTHRLLSRQIRQVELPVNDGWARDAGPMFVINGKGDRRVAGFTFNGWGAKFPPYRDDALLKARLCHHLDVSMYPIDLCLEGGAVALDGAGTALTTEQCLLNKNRNSSANRKEIERQLGQALGVTKTIWLSKGLQPDPVTDGHVDGMAAFARPGTVLLHTTQDRSDPNFKICQDAKIRLRESTDAQGRKLEIIEVPLDGNLSFVNFYIANDCVLVPTDPRQDQRPLGVLREVFADRNVIGIDSTILGEGGGGIHCITQQVPAV